MNIKSGDILKDEVRMLRRVPEKLWHVDRPMSGFLKARPKDEGCSSLHHKELTTLQNVLDAATQKNEDIAAVISFQVCAISMAASKRSVSAPVIYSPKEDDISHSHIDFRQCNGKQQDKISASVLVDNSFMVEWLNDPAP